MATKSDNSTNNNKNNNGDDLASNFVKKITALIIMPGQQTW